MAAGNDVGSDHLKADLSALREVLPLVDAVVLPKASLVAVEELSAGVNRPVVALIETAAGVEEAWQIAQHDAVAAVLFGALDYMTDLSRSGGVHALDTGWAQGRIVNAAAAARVWPIAGPTAAFEDLSVLRSDSIRQAVVGFAGKLCIHPRQLSVVDEVFSPSDEMVAWARRIDSAAGVDGAAGALEVDGEVAPLNRTP
jgi:citrate lyase beta subunit